MPRLILSALEITFRRAIYFKRGKISQKIGVLNKQGWAKYLAGDLEFVKRFDFIENAAYPDMNSNTELYTAGSFVEIETLAPLQRLAPNASTEHIEHWQLNKLNLI